MMNEGHEEINERELVSLVAGAVLLAIVLLVIISISNSTASASSWWYLVDLYADHYHGHHVYLPVVGR